MALRRRDLFRFGGLSGGIGLFGAAGLSVGKLLGAKDTRPAPLPALDIDCTSTASQSSGGIGYPAKFAPPAYLTGDRGGFHIPPAHRPFSADAREFDLSVIETTLEIANGQNVDVWAYGGTVPGPIIRTTVGQRIKVTMTNHLEIAHSVH